MAEVSKRFGDLGSDGSPAKLGLMGGTFDPIHIGHLRVAEEVREALQLDAVLFIPTGNPAFKADQHVTDAHVRLEQVRQVVADNPHFDVSAIEVERDGATYTIDTLRELRAHYPDNVEFYFIIGSDAAALVGKWRECSALAELTSLAVAVGRPGYAQAGELRTSILEAAPFDIEFVQVSELEVSSSDIRRRISEGKSVRYLMPPELKPSRVARLVESLRESSGDSFEDALSKAFFKARKKELEQRVSPKRFAHSLGVCETCERLAHEYGLDVDKARLAGLLHDWDKGMDDDQLRERVKSLDMEDEIDPFIVEAMPGVLHGMTAARALALEFPSIPIDVLQAIDRHTTAAIDMQPLDMVLYTADALEPNRQFGRIDELRSLVGKTTLEDLYFKTYEYWVFLLFERGKPLHPDTITIWNAYAQRSLRKGKRGTGDKSVSRKKGKRKK